MRHASSPHIPLSLSFTFTASFLSEAQVIGLYSSGSKYLLSYTLGTHGDTVTIGRA